MTAQIALVAMILQALDLTFCLGLSGYTSLIGDEARLNKVFPVLAAYYKWLKLNRTWRNGTYWSSGWGTGMDNMPRVKEPYNTIYSNGHMVWLDACLQQMNGGKHLY